MIYAIFSLFAMNILCYYVTKTYFNFWYYYVVHLPHTLFSTFLCMRYPFLVSRNRFTGLKYNNGALNNYLSRYMKVAKKDVIVYISNEADRKTVDDFSHSNFDLLINYHDGTLLIKYKNKTVFELEIDNVLRYGFTEDGTVLNIVLKGDTKYTNHFLTFSYVVDYKTERLLSFIEWIYKNPMQWFAIIHTSSEYDSIERGWRKRFGLKMIEEYRKRLIKIGGRKALRQYRITDIKEKWGRLVWDYPPVGCDDIARKYDKMSWDTCIICGKPSTHITTGWYSPYCYECVGGRKSVKKEDFEKYLDENF